MICEFRGSVRVAVACAKRLEGVTLHSALSTDDETRAPLRAKRLTSTLFLIPVPQGLEQWKPPVSEPSCRGSLRIAAATNLPSVRKNYNGMNRRRIVSWSFECHIAWPKRALGARAVDDAKTDHWLDPVAHG